MKQIALSIEQMQHLKDLGCDTSNASMVRIFADVDGNILEWDEVEKTDTKCQIDSISEYMYIDEEDGNYKGASQALLSAKYGDYDHSYRKYCGCFTLEDIIELLPNEISIKEKSQTYYLSIDKGKCGYLIHDKESNDFKTLISYFGNPLESTYKMLCCVLEYKYNDLL